MPSPKTCLAFFVFVATAFHAGSSEVTNIPEIGIHQPILIVEKNVNPQNKMVVYTKLDANGHFMADGNRPLLDFYWLMDGKNYKPVNGKIKKEIHNRSTAQWSSKDRAHFIVNVDGLKEVKSDIKEPRMDVYARKTHQGMNVEAQMTLGPSDGHMRIKVSSIYTEGRAFPAAVDAVTLKGEKIVNGSPTGKKVTRTYYAAGRSG